MCEKSSNFGAENQFIYMNVKEITKRIYYVGVNDRATERFEAMWPLPFGVSYNSYLVDGGSKCALIDSVELDTFSSLAEHLKTTCGNRPIDYLVVNHTEPDHSGSIPVLLEKYPAMKIVCNKISADQIRGFYGVSDDNRFHVVADGDTLELGDKTLRFITTPMVHWPETMMTWCKEDKVLFTGDAFGCFGALNGIVTDDGMDEALFGHYTSEMYRYYSNIVAKYGKFVQGAIAKTVPFEIEYLCPTHGPVWRERAREVGAIYNKLSRWEPEEGAVVVFGSMYGNTAGLVDNICDALAAQGQRKIMVHNASKEELSEIISDCVRYKTIIIGSPTYSMDIFPPVAAVVRALAVREPKNKKVGVFGSFTWANGVIPKLTAAFTDMGLPPTATLVMKHARSGEIVADIEAFAKALTD